MDKAKSILKKLFDKVTGWLTEHPREIIAFGIGFALGAYHSWTGL